MRAWQDLRAAWRGLRRNLSFAITAILILAAGIAVNTTVFSIVNATLLRPLPYRDTDRITIVWEKRRKDGTQTNGVTPADYLDWRAQNHVFSALTAHDEGPATLTGLGDPERVVTVWATPDMFATYGIQPVLGHGFDLSKRVVLQKREALVTYGFWTRHFGSEPSVLNRVIHLNDEPYTIVGVLPADFRMYIGRVPDVFVPLELTGERARDRGSHDLLVVGRLRPGVTLGEAQAEMDAISTPSGARLAGRQHRPRRQCTCRSANR